MTVVAPHILTNPSLKIGPTATLKEVICTGHNVELSPEQDSNDYDSWCGGSVKVYGPEKWTLTLTSYQSFSTPDGLWTILHPLVGQIVDFELLPDSTLPVSATNPLAKGQVRVPAIAFLAGAINEASEITVEMPVQGVPQFLITAPTGLETAAGFDPSTRTVADVIAYVDANPGEVQAVLDAERAGQNRVTLVNDLQGRVG